MAPDASAGRVDPADDAARSLGLDLGSPFADVLLARAGRLAAAPARPVGSAVERVAAAVGTLRRGGIVLLVRSAGGADQGSLLLPVASATPATIAFLQEHCPGVLGVALPAGRCAELALTAMVADDTAEQSVVFGVSVDAAASPSGASVADLCRTIHVLGAPDSRAGDLRRPGHVFPLIAREGGVLDGGGPAEAALDLVRLAGLPAAAVVCDVVLASAGAAGRADELAALGERHGIPVLRLEDLVVHCRLHQGAVRLGASTRLPTPHGTFTADLVVSTVQATEVLVLRTGDLAAGEDADPDADLDPGQAPAPLVGIHVECLLGDAFGSRRCPCSARLEQLLGAVAAEPRGAVLYLRPGDRPGSGVLAELVRYAEQEGTGAAAHDRPERPAHLLDVAADVLHLLGVERLRLADDDPAAVEAIERLGMTVDPVSLALPPFGEERARAQLPV